MGFGLDIFSYDSVKSAPSLISDDPGVNLQTIPFLVLLNELLLLQLLQPPPDNLSARLLMPLRSNLAPIKSSINMRQQPNPSPRPDVDFPGQGGDSEIDPVFVDGGEFVS